MKVVSVRLPYQQGTKLKIVLTGDCHFGSRQCDTKLLKKMVKKYAGQPDTKLILMGDEIDAIASSDKRFDSMSVAEEYRGARNFMDLIVDDFVDIMMPLRGQIIAGVDGNHSKAYRKLSDSDPYYRVSKALEYERLGYAGYVCVCFDWHKTKGSRGNRTRVVNYFVSHGKPSTAQTVGGALNTVANSAQWFVSDILAHGHTHRLSAGNSRIMFIPDPKNKTYKKIKQHLVQTGSYLKSYSFDEFSPYSELRLYPPIDLGWACTEISFEEYTEPKIKTWTNEAS